MQDFLAGMKIYSLDWYWKYDLSYEQLAGLLKEWGINFVITQNAYLPMDDSAVKSEIPEEKQERMQAYDDEKTRSALQKEGIGYFGAYNIFFNSELIGKYKNYAYDMYGDPADKIDWYIGACPTCEEYINEVIEKIKNAFTMLDMDGIFLGFMRFPGFWEMMLPDTDMHNWKEYCFCPSCISRFEHEAGIKVQPPIGKTKGEWIAKTMRTQWTDYKCRVIADIVARIKKAICEIRPDAKLILNTLPFVQEEEMDYGRDLFGQDPRMLKDSVDIFEVMGYHQILSKPIEWIGRTGEFFKKETGKTTVCTLQSKALYTEGMHAGSGRNLKITASEFSNAVLDVKKSKVDGVVVFTLSDFLKSKYEDRDDLLIQILKEKLGKG